MRTQPTCSHAVPEDQMMCHRLPAMPSRFHPQLNGSDRLLSRKVITDNTVVSAKAIQQPNPIGISAALVTRNCPFTMKADLPTTTPPSSRTYHTTTSTPTT